MMDEHYDWTAKNGKSNSSDEYLRLVAEVERLIRDDAHMLISGKADKTAGLIMAQLAHKHGLAPLRDNPPAAPDTDG